MVQLVKVKENEQKILKNLLSLYLHDLSQYSHDLDINDEGYFEYDSFAAFFEEELLHPYLIKNNNDFIGLILVSEAPYAKPSTNYCIQEFFILKKYRGRGLAQEAISQLFTIFKGIYSLMILKTNRPALHFWRNYYKSNKIGFEEGDETNPHYENCLYHIFSVKE